ncbi:DUF4003 family protein [Planococcus sp. ISL-110]|uniref:DUF4003 family protein n=1 Tax=Planococcus sp. ISL-110 TaxID=2819167 RepID=UPI0020358D72|nr:DUF4003 family protein [Planococcus sp. ISL-110]
MDIKRIEQAFSEVSKTTGEDVDKRIALAVTNIYLSRDQAFDAEMHERAVGIIKKNEGWTSLLRSHLLHIAEAFMVAKKEDLESSLKLVNQNQKELNNAGFWKTSYTYLAALLMKSPEEAERAATMNMYYHDLREQGFTMGNDLQWLSWIMTFDSPAYDPGMVGRVLAIHQLFKDEKIKIRLAQFPILGFLAVTQVGGGRSAERNCGKHA